MNKHSACSRLQRFFYWFILSLVLAFAKAEAQQTSSTKNETQLLKASFQVVDIDIHQYFELEIKTTEGDEIKITTTQNGEYKNAVILSSVVQNDSLIITDPINPSFSFPGDKLSAHKVIDGKATISIPQSKNVILNTQNADLIITGDYKSLYINQLSGSCKIEQLKGNLTYVTAYADVFLDLKHHQIKAISRSGDVSKFITPVEIDFFALIETVSGNIRPIKKTKK